MSSAPRLRSALLAAACLLLAPSFAAAAEPATEIFIVDSSDGYGIDGCVAAGQSCGQAMADAWCRVHDFERATGFGKVKSDATISAISTAPVRTACYGTGCAETVAITCAR
ncbi:hypothetical protein [Ancylobacter radicis]|uniref:DUF4189 domain-containing protein n=1 Tax=Ancylobacter radicis TaxID=2836179 RepID=A0ABS5RA15_9HYPH|nr:hypothetical protein [Ancylobacter radicis]MBS9478115.1 hypothetical protein [Ancylobacter radicis]